MNIAETQFGLVTSQADLTGACSVTDGGRSQFCAQVWLTWESPVLEWHGCKWHHSWCQLNKLFLLLTSATDHEVLAVVLIEGGCLTCWMPVEGFITMQTETSHGLIKVYLYDCTHLSHPMLAQVGFGELMDLNLGGVDLAYCWKQEGLITLH